MREIPDFFWTVYRFEKVMARSLCRCPSFLGKNWSHALKLQRTPAACRNQESLPRRITCAEWTEHHPDSLLLPPEVFSSCPQEMWRQEVKKGGERTQTKLTSVGVIWSKYSLLIFICTCILRLVKMLRPSYLHF